MNKYTTVAATAIAAATIGLLPTAVANAGIFSGSSSGSGGGSGIEQPVGPELGGIETGTQTEEEKGPDKPIGVDSGTQTDKPSTSETGTDPWTDGHEGEAGGPDTAEMGTGVGALPDGWDKHAYRMPTMEEEMKWGVPKMPIPMHQGTDTFKLTDLSARQRDTWIMTPTVNDRGEQKVVWQQKSGGSRIETIDPGQIPTGYDFLSHP